MFVVVCVLGYAADQVTKWLALQHLDRDEVVPTWTAGSGSVCCSTPVPPLAGGRHHLAVHGGRCRVVVVIVRVSRRLGSLRWAFALGQLLSGALGNLTDRLLREPGGSPVAT